MNQTLRKYINKYFNMVDFACTEMMKYYSLNCKADLLEYIAANRIWEVEMSGISYHFHGVGCIAEGENFWVNWDFGGGEARWCGVDPWFVAQTIKENAFPNAERYSGSFIKAACEEAVLTGEMIKGGSCYYFTVPKEEMIKPEFPDQYDTLFIEQFGISWEVKRSKVIDRFIRKATWVHNKVYENPFSYKLSFYLEGKEIYSIPYNDISYPKKAVTIMSREIIGNLKKK